MGNVVGEVGGATLCMHRNLEIERLVLAAMSLGIAKRSIEVMTSYAQERKAFGKQIGDYGQVCTTQSFMRWFVSLFLPLSSCVCLPACLLASCGGMI